MALSLFNPTRDLFSLPDEMGLFFPRLDTTVVASRAMAVDVKETENTYEVKADLPGISKPDINVSVDKHVLTISVESKGEKKEDKDEEGVKYHRVERHSSFVSRSLRMPTNADLDNIKAKFDNGVLTLDVPKKQTNGDKAVKRISIE